MYRRVHAHSGDVCPAVRRSWWGKPERINRTTTAHGDSEQWIYSFRGVYMYLDNGILTAVQTDNVQN
jgi:hypothetical protein